MSRSKKNAPSLDRLKKLVGADELSFDPQVLDDHKSDKWFASRLPDAVVFATSAATVSRVLQFATKNKIPVTARGSGVGYVGGCVPQQGGIVLSLARMNRILEVNAADGIARVEPGVITGTLQDAARAQGLFYPPDPASLRECSIGGNIATNAGGPRCLKYGVTRPYVLGLEAVLPTGDIIRAGSRTHKNKTGFDLIGLFVGSEGMLGVVTEATLRLLPMPPARACISTGFRNIAAAARAVQLVFKGGHLPSALEIADAFTLRAARKYLGAGLVPEGNAHLLLEIDGQSAPVRSELRSLLALLVEAGAVGPVTAFGDVPCERLWNLRRQFSQSLKSTGLTKLNEDIAVPRGRLVDLVRFAASLQKKYGYPVACFGHAGDGNIHVNIMAADYRTDDVVREKVDAALDELFRQVLAWGGVITGEHGVGLAKKRWWTSALDEPTRRLHATLKQAMDPEGILNPGKFV
jgi:glycolate oxidase